MKVRHRRTALALLFVVAAAPAWADGTLGLDEVLFAAVKAPKLVAEIQAELDKNGLKADDVTCLGARHGNRWKYLSAFRAAPYQCKIGKRMVAIEARRVYFDARGRIVADGEGVFERAKTFKEDNFRWTWTP